MKELCKLSTQQTPEVVFVLLHVVARARTASLAVIPMMMYSDEQDRMHSQPLPNYTEQS